MNKPIAPLISGSSSKQSNLLLESENNPTMNKNPSDAFKSPISLTITHSYTGIDTSSNQHSPHAYFDEDNRKVVIISAH